MKPYIYVGLISSPMRQFWFSMEELRQIGKNIRKFRVKRDMTQLDLAAACNFDESAVGRLENGNTNPTIKTLLKIAKALGVKLTDLVKLK